MAEQSIFETPFEVAIVEPMPPDFSYSHTIRQPLSLRL